MMDTSKLTMGIDVSFWQDLDSTPQGIDFKKAAAAGAQFVFVRGGQGTVMDSDFVYNYREAKAAGLLRGVYLFGDYRSYPGPQAEFLANLVKEDMPELPLVLDVEKHTQWGELPTRYNMLIWIQTFLKTLDTMTRRQTMIYLNPDWIRNYLAPIPFWLSACPLWLAHYTTGKPDCGAWLDWTFWQATAKGDGKAMGMESLNVDIDYYNGDLAKLHEYSLKVQGIKVKPPVEMALTTEEKVNVLWGEYIKRGGQV